ncbi:phosphatase PAP2 family protein [Kutzneria buriramensis]|uniref:phosphatase PAP2 family protein n=1 Tax=Kutzneria buriramensis TaxID=1045776 RepID=UPI0014777568|nr:phosphatase PAP2 family protein [Kutzneria buriramensis]
MTLLLAAALLTVAVAVPFGPLLVVDHAVADGLHGYAVNHPAITTAMQTWTDICQPWTFRAILAATAAWLWWRRRPWQAAWVVTTATVCSVVETALKASLGRVRPHWTDPLSTAAGGSYPSGHALTSAMACAVLLILAWPTATRTTRQAFVAAAMAIPLVTGFTRLYLGVHFVSDVVGGWLIAVALVAATVKAFSGVRARR